MEEQKKTERCGKVDCTRCNGAPATRDWDSSAQISAQRRAAPISEAQLLGACGSRQSAIAKALRLILKPLKAPRTKTHPPRAITSAIRSFFPPGRGPLRDGRAVIAWRHTRHRQPKEKCTSNSNSFA